MLKIKLSKRGFSLIEIMVAVAILGIVSVGIFQSFKVGFWGMSDARARTIATNIAQEKLEEVKGKSLDTRTFPDPDNPIVISGKEFNVTIIIEEIKSTLKKITTKVNWKKRNGEQTEISIESLLNMPPVFPADDVATSILVNTSRTSISLTDEDKTSTITVMILDQDNYPISYNGQVDLLFDPDTPVLGTFADNALIFNGESSLFTIFTASDAGEVDIKAESEGLISDSVTIKITGGDPAEINLVVDQASILIGGETSTLTVRIEDGEGNLANSWTGTVKLQLAFSIDKDGNEIDTGDLGDLPVGDIDTITIAFVNENQNVRTTLFTSSNEAGEAVIEATDITTSPSTLLEPDEETIYVSSGPPTQIDIEADPKSILISGYESEITVTIKNAAGTLTSGFVGFVDLSILSGIGSGTLAEDPSFLEFDGEEKLTTLFTSLGTPGTVEIQAEDRAGVLTSDTETITVTVGPPNKIILNAIPNIILNNGTDSAVITVTTEDELGNRSGVEGDTTITLTAKSGEVPPQSVGNIGNAGVGNSKLLSFEAGESLKITTFTCDETYEGEVTITATVESGDGYELDEHSVTVIVTPAVIRPAEDPNIQYGYHYWWWIEITDENIIYFDIEILGGLIEIYEIDVSWTPNNNETLRGIRISNIDGDTIIDGTWDGEESVVEVPKSNFSTYNDLDVGIYTVRLLFNTDIVQKDISIKFFTNFENYQLEFLSPDQTV